MKLIKGTELTPAQTQQVKSAFIMRNTVEQPFPLAGGDGTDTDTMWLAARAFYFTQDGSLAARRSAQPAFLADAE